MVSRIKTWILLTELSYLNLNYTSYSKAYCWKQPKKNILFYCLKFKALVTAEA